MADTRTDPSEPECRQSGACWAIPGVFLVAMAAALAFAAPLTAPQKAQASAPAGTAAAGND